MAIGLAFTLPFMPGASAATPHEVFTVDRIPVDVTAKTASAAKTIAIQSGQRAALDKLMMKIVRAQDVPMIPRLEDYWINEIVSGLEFYNERSSSVRYLANLTVSFDKQGIYNLLQRLEIPFSETPAKPMLLLPVQRYGGTTTLWSDQNWWAQAWEKADLHNQLVEFVLPKGELGDRLVINAQQAVRVNAPSLEAVTAKYGVDEALIATATIGQDFGSGEYKVRLEAVKWPQGSVVANIEMSGGVDAGGASQTSMGEYPLESAANNEEDALEGLLARATAKLVAAVAEGWKQQTMIYFGETRQLAAKVPLRSLEEWVRISGRLKSVSAIRHAEIVSLSVTNADVLLRYAGQTEQLKLALSQANIDILQSEDGWLIQLTENDAKRQP